MKIIVLLFLLCILAVKGFSQNTLLDNIWLTQNKEAKIKFYIDKDAISGKIIWLEKPFDRYGEPVKDVNNPDEGLRTRELMDLIIFKNFEFKDEEWINGTLYDPTDGETYKCKIWFENNSILKVRGYLGILFETETWTKSQL